MCAHIFRGKQCKLPRISLIAICTALNSGDIFSKPHLTPLLHSIGTDCSKLRASISKLKHLQHLHGCSICNKVNEVVIAKPSALLIAKFKQRFHSCWDSPGIKSKETRRLRGCSGYSRPPALAQDTVLVPPGGGTPSEGRGYLLLCTGQSHNGDRETGPSPWLPGALQGCKHLGGWKGRPRSTTPLFCVPPHHLVTRFHGGKLPDPSLMPSDLFCHGPLDSYLVLPVSS